MPYDNLPRQKCRGLIEAYGAGGNQPLTRLIFPGRNAGASLKHSASTLGPSTRQAIFPGRNAGASLKLAGVRDGRLGHLHLPRQKCRGLIEASM